MTSHSINSIWGNGLIQRAQEYVTGGARRRMLYMRGRALLGTYVIYMIIYMYVWYYVWIVYICYWEIINKGNPGGDRFWLVYWVLDLRNLQDGRHQEEDDEETRTPAIRDPFLLYLCHTLPQEDNRSHDEKPEWPQPTTTATRRRHYPSTEASTPKWIGPAPNDLGGR